LSLAAACVVGFRPNYVAAAPETWAPGGTAGGSGTWDTLTSNWSYAGSLTTWANASTDATFGVTGGTVGVAPGGINLETGSFGVTGYIVQGGTITLVGTTPGIYEGGVSGNIGTTTINSAIAGSSGAKFAGGGASYGTLILNGSNSYTGNTILSQLNLVFQTLANSGSNSSFGQGGGTVTLVTNGSTVHAQNNGAGGSTNTLWQLGSTGVGDILNEGTGAIAFTGVGTAETGTAGARHLQLDGGSLTTNMFVNTFGETITDMGGGASNITGLAVYDASWAITGTNTYSGGTTINSTHAQLEINQASSLGSGSLTFVSSGTLTATAGLTFSNPVSVNTGTTSNATANFLGSTLLGPSNTFVVSSPISDNSNTGALSAYTVTSIRLSTPSISDAPIEINNDSNTFSGAVSTGNGLIQYTSVATIGSPSSLGTGANSATITIGNGSSYATFQYVGSGGDTTNRPISYTGYGNSGNFSLDSSGTGYVQYLATGPIRAGISTVANTNTITLTGTSTGNNVLAQVINDNPTTIVNSSTTYVGGVTTVAKSLAGTWILTGSNTYSGATSVTGGNLTIDASDPSSTLTGVTANANASIANSGTVTIGAAGTLHLLNSGASAPVNMLSTNATVTVTDGAIIDLDLNGQTQTVSTFVVDNVDQPAGTYASSSYTATPTTGTDTAFFEGNGALVVTNSPEPSSTVLLGAGSLGLLRRRRRAARKV
jgi:fibronectin-binding autotransporter adhesin